MQAKIAGGIWLSLALAGCGNSPSLVINGDVQRGEAAVFRYGCGSCHTISRISSARGRVGPRLTGIREQMYVAGVLQNTPENMELWIRNPKSFNAKTAMPSLGVTEQDAADITALLYSQ
jgi:cytochrome c